MGYGGGYGRGRGMGMGRGRGLGWLAVGYGPGGDEAVTANIQLALEERLAFLRAELPRTEALLRGEAPGENVPANVDAVK